MRKYFILLLSAALPMHAVWAGPGDGPVVDAGQITIHGQINGEIKNGRQGGSGGGSALWGLVSVSGGASAAPGGNINVNGIVQVGQSLLKANSIMLDTKLNRDITNNAGDITVSGITQVGKN